MIEFRSIRSIFKVPLIGLEIEIILWWRLLNVHFPSIWTTYPDPHRRKDRKSIQSKVRNWKLDPVPLVVVISGRYRGGCRCHITNLTRWRFVDRKRDSNFREACINRASELAQKEMFRSLRFEDYIIQYGGCFADDNYVMHNMLIVGTRSAFSKQSQRENDAHNRQSDSVGNNS